MSVPTNQGHPASRIGLRLTICDLLASRSTNPHNGRSPTASSRSKKARTVRATAMADDKQKPSGKRPPGDKPPPRPKPDGLKKVHSDRKPKGDKRR